jgi:thiamine pyrophosphokinase
LKSKAVIFLNGTPPDFRLAKKLIGKDTIVISADGASNYLIKSAIKPHIIIGDLDSIKKNVLSSYIKNGTQIIKLDEQETTDFEKALLYCGGHKINIIHVFGALSERADHTLNNFSVLKRYNRNFAIKLYDNEFEVFFIPKKHSFKYKNNEVVSFLAVPFAGKVRTAGLKYPLYGEDLEFGVREGTLNRSKGRMVEISYTKGCLLLFKKHFIKYTRQNTK